MAALTISIHGVMEGGGSYNLHANIPRWRQPGVAVSRESGSILRTSTRKQCNRHSGLRFFPREKLSIADARGYPVLAYASATKCSVLVLPAME